jgi:hypothetical protein
MQGYGSSSLLVIDVVAGAEKTSWKQIQAACRDLTPWGSQLLQSGLNGYVGTVLVEPHYVCKDYRNLFSRFYSKKFLGRSPYCSRLHFFSARGLTVDDIWSRPDLHQSEYIGFSVIQPVLDHCIGRTMIDPYKIGKDPDAFYCLETVGRVRINGTEYSVRGYPYSSQSKEATLCAHASLWGVCRYLSDRYPNYAEVYPHDLIEMTGSELGRRVPYRGMTLTDYAKILSAFGCYPVMMKPRTNGQDWSQDIEAFHDIYSYVESGFPVLVSFDGHVATITGHTLQDSTGLHDHDCLSKGGKRIKTRFHNSFSLTKQFVVVDDNVFPYTLLGYPGDTANYGRAFDKVLRPAPSISSIFGVVVPLPEKAFLPPSKARRLSYMFLQRPALQSALDRTLADLRIPDCEPLIARLFLTSSGQFKKRKGMCVRGEVGPEADELAKVVVDTNLPHFVWVMEVSPLRYHNDRHCIGEVVLDASASEDEAEYVCLRMGRTVIRSGTCKESSTGLLSYPQYTHNLGERDA